MFSHMDCMAPGIAGCIFCEGNVDRNFWYTVGKAHRTMLDSDVNKPEDGYMGFGTFRVIAFAYSRRMFQSTGDRTAAFVYMEQGTEHRQQTSYKASWRYDHTIVFYLQLRGKDISSKAHHRDLYTCVYISFGADKVPYRLHFCFESILNAPCDHRDVSSLLVACTSYFHTVDYKALDTDDHSSDSVCNVLCIFLWMGRPCKAFQGSVFLHNWESSSL